jgi:hypothetical protein
MRERKKIYTNYHRLSAFCMIVALFWLTISTPFVFASQQYAAEHGATASASLPATAGEEEAANPFGSNTTEEKTPSSSSFSEEYLHDHHPAHPFFNSILQYHKGENAGTYVAFHGELLVPPPNRA